VGFLDIILLFKWGK